MKNLLSIFSKLSISQKVYGGIFFAFIIYILILGSNFLLFQKIKNISFEAQNNNGKIILLKNIDNNSKVLRDNLTNDKNNSLNINDYQYILDSIKTKMHKIKLDKQNTIYKIIEYIEQIFTKETIKKDIKIQLIKKEIDTIDYYLKDITLQKILAVQKNINKQISILNLVSRQLIFACIIIFLLAFTSSLFIYRSLISRIINLRNIAIKIREGKLDQQIDILANDEIGDLESALLLMTKKLLTNQRNLEKYNRNLELEVAKRTKDLSDNMVELQFEIIEREKAEEMVRENEARFKALFDNIHSGVTIYTSISNGKNFILLDINKSGEIIDQVMQEDVIGVHITELYPSIIEYGLLKVAQRVWETGRSEIFPLKYYEDSRIKGWREHFIYRLHNNEVVIVYDDVTEKIEKKAEKHKLEQQLQQSRHLESIGTLAAGIAHEINTPIQFISDNIEFVDNETKKIFDLISKYQSKFTEKRKIEKKPQTMTEIIDIKFLKKEIPKAILESKDGLKRVSKIVTAMKSFSHMDIDKKNNIDINKEIENTTIICRNEWKYVSDLEFHFAENQPILYCYIHEIQQAIMNLIINAAHAIAEKFKEKKGKIIVTTKENKDSIIIKIFDNGTGIPKELQNKIFDPFFTTKDLGKGTGQGLSIAYATIVEKHKGTLTFETESKKGTTFIIEVPKGKD